MNKSSLIQLVDREFGEVEYLANLVAAFSHVSDLTRKPLREHISDQMFLSGKNYNEVSDLRLTEILFLEADEYLGKALCNLCAGCAGMSRGYLSWGEVTTYYASFFAIHGLLRIQGKALGMDYVLFPQSIRSPASILRHEYAVARHVGKARVHEDVWRKFYDTYSQNIDIDQAEYADVIFFSSVQDIVLEVERRNRFNYWVFDSYQEVCDATELSRRKLFDLARLDPRFLENLTQYLADSDRRYLARAALRVRLLHDLLYCIVENSPVLMEYFSGRHTQRLAFLDTVLHASEPIDRTSVEEGCLFFPSTAS